MRLVLENFLCHENITFDLGENGLSLISGRSGRGKTSILKAIFFALFGEGNKLQTYGKKSAKVELEFDDLKIVRTKRPNRLILNDKYEDATAQGIINKKFGKTFKTSGYVQQNNLTSFILMSPTDKLAFLEKFAFESINLREIKAKCKAKIVSSNNELISAVSQLDIANQMVDELDEPEYLECPLKCNKKNRNKAIKNEKIRLKNSRILLKRALKTRKKTENHIASTNILDAIVNSNQNNLDKISSKLCKKNLELKNLKYSGDENLAKLENKLKQIVNQGYIAELEKKYYDYKEKLDKMEKAESKKWENELTEIKENLWKSHNREETLETVKELESCVKDLSSLEKFKNELDDMESYDWTSEKLKDYISGLNENYDNLRNKYRKAKIASEAFKCPKCSAKLKFQDDTLVLLSDISEKKVDLSELLREIKKSKLEIKKEEILLGDINVNEKIKKDLEKKINEIKEVWKEDPEELSQIKEDLEYMKTYKEEQILNEKRLKKIQKRGPLSVTVLNFREETENLESKLENLKSSLSFYDIDFSTDEEELREEISREKDIKKTLKRIEESIQELEIEKGETEKIIENAKSSYIQEYKEQKSVEYLKKKLEKIELEISDYTKKEEKQTKIIENIENWKKYKEEMKKYNNWVEKISFLEDAQKEARKKYSSFLKLKEKILEAESIALKNIIDVINSHARLYLEDFFPEDPISVELQAFKESKKKVIKPSINIVIEYKTMECNLNMLSGGELARVVLGYTLALAEIFNTPLLLLDECTASLDQEMTGIVFDSIKEHFNGKVALIIAHQVVSGVFDKVINL